MLATWPKTKFSRGQWQKMNENSYGNIAQHTWKETWQVLVLLVFSSRDMAELSSSELDPSSLLSSTLSGSGAAPTARRVGTGRRLQGTIKYKNYANLHTVVKICQIFISKLLKAVNSDRFNQSDLDTRSWYHRDVIWFSPNLALPIFLQAHLHIRRRSMDIGDKKYQANNSIVLP